MPEPKKNAPLVALAAAFVAAGLWIQPGCTPKRDPVDMSCTGNQHCPADGFWFCDLTTHQCKHCAGTCPVQAIPDMDAGTLPGDVTQTTDAVPSTDAGPLGCDSGLPVPDGIGQEGPSCYGMCSSGSEAIKGTVEGDDCYCDAACVKNDDCCFDYEARCGCLAAVGTDTCDQRCGDRTAGGTCQCDANCAGLGDCCSDFTTFCFSCAGHCADEPPVGLGAGTNVCYCDDKCSENSDCCYDRDQICSADGG